MIKNKRVKVVEARSAASSIFPQEMDKYRRSELANRLAKLLLDENIIVFTAEDVDGCNMLTARLTVVAPKEKA